MLRTLLFCAAFAASTAAVADSEIDTSFGVFSTGHNVIAIDGGGNNTDAVAEALVAPDNSIFLVGSSNVVGSNQFRATLVHLLPNGQLDTDWGNNGRFVQVGYPLVVNSAAFNSDGDIVVGGTRPIAGNNSDFIVCKFHGAAPSNFSATATTCVTVPFDLGGTLQDSARRLLMLADGRMLLMGSVKDASNRDVAGLALLKPDGTLDASFGMGGKLAYLPANLGSAALYGAAVEGGIVYAVGEGVVMGSGNHTAVVLKINLGNGAIINDASLLLGSAAGPAFFRDVTVLPNLGPVAVGGTISGGKPRGVATLLSPVLEPTPGWGNADGFGLMLGGDGIGLSRVTQQSDGKFLVAGTLTPNGGNASQLIVGRYEIDGGVDYARFNTLQGYRGVDFQMPGIYDSNPVLALQAGQPILAGSISAAQGTANTDMGVARLKNDQIFSARFGQRKGED